MTARNGQAPRRDDPSVLREASAADKARQEIQHASNPWGTDDATQMERDWHLKMAEIQSRLAMAESIDMLARVIDGVWQQAARELVYFRTSRAGEEGGRKM